MKKSLIAPLLIAVMLLLGQQPCSANGLVQPQPEAPSRSDSEQKLPDQDSRELMYKDTLMLFLLPHIEKKMAEIYSPLLTITPTVYPYLVERSPFLIDVESVVAASINISCTVTPLARASLNKVLNTSSGSFTNVPAGFFFWISLICFLLLVYSLAVVSACSAFH